MKKYGKICCLICKYVHEGETVKALLAIIPVSNQAPAPTFEICEQIDRFDFMCKGSITSDIGLNTFFTNDEVNDCF